MQAATRTLTVTIPLADTSFLRKQARCMGWQVAAMPSKKNKKDETEYMLSSKKMTEIIRQGLEDANNGNYQIVNIDEL